MAEHYHHQHQKQQGQPLSHQVVKAATAVTAGGSLLVLSGLTLAGTVVALALVTPLLVIFSPVLVPAAITVCLLLTGFVSSGGFGTAGLTVFMWMYRYLNHGWSLRHWTLKLFRFLPLFYLKYLAFNLTT